MKSTQSKEPHPFRHFSTVPVAGTVLGGITADLFPILCSYYKACLATEKPTLKPHHNYTWKSQFNIPASVDDELGEPFAAVLDWDGRIHVADYRSSLCVVFEQDGTFLRTYGKEGTNEGEFRNPGVLALDNNGDIIVIDQNSTVQTFDNASGAFKWRFGGWKKVKQTPPQQFSTSYGVVVDVRNNFWITDYNSHRIQQYDSRGEWIKSIGRRGGQPGEFYHPCGMDINPDGHLVVCDQHNHRIQVLTMAGEALRTFGEEGKNSCQFSYPWGLHCDSNGLIVVTEQCMSHLFAPCLLFGRLGSAGVEEGQLSDPLTTVINQEGHLIIADSSNRRLVRFE